MQEMWVVMGDYIEIVQPKNNTKPNLELDKTYMLVP